METIWKFPLDVADVQTVALPVEAQILSVQVQNGIPCLWAKLDPDEAKKDRSIVIHGTGHKVMDAPMRFIGTFQLDGGALVFHVFEI